MSIMHCSFDTQFDPFASLFHCVNLGVKIETNGNEYVDATPGGWLHNAGRGMLVGSCDARV